MALAKQMVPGFLLALQLKSQKPVTKTIKVPVSVLNDVSLDNLEVVVGSDCWKDIQLSVDFDNREIKISGPSDPVADAKQKIDGFLSMFKTSRKRQSSVGTTSDEDGNASTLTKKRNNHRNHICFFCKGSKSSRHFRNHCSTECTHRNAILFSEIERNEIVDQYYKKESMESFQNWYDLTLDSKISRIENDTAAKVVNVVNDENSSSRKVTKLDNLLIAYEDYLNNPISGKARFDDKTLSSRIGAFKRLANMAELYFLEQLLKKNDIMKILSILEDLNYRDATRYDYVLSVLEFLQFCKQEDDISPSLHHSITIAIDRWEKARKNFQKGLVSERAVKKKRDILERERGDYPMISEVAQCALYFRKKVPVIKRSTYTNDSLNKFLTWLAFNLSKSNALRPSSIGNMKVSEFLQPFSRESTKIVCVEGLL